MFVIYAVYNKQANKFYIGQTEYLARRINEHNSHTYQGYTSRFQGLWELIYQESAANRSEALAREKQLKSFRGRQFIKQQIPK